METEILLITKVNENYAHTQDHTVPSSIEDSPSEFTSLAMKDNKEDFLLSSGNTTDVVSDKKEPPDLNKNCENILPKVSIISTVTNKQ